MERIKSAAKEAGIVVVLGYSERDGASLYIAQSYIVDGEIVHHRRKIKPTHVERSIWGEGGANSMKTVVNTKHGKIGALCCFEHYQPLLRYYEYFQRAQIHVAAWPPFFESDSFFQGTPAGSRLASQFFAMEGQAFVLVSTQVVMKKNLKMMGLPDNESNEVSFIRADKSSTTDNSKGGGGFAMIYGPDGRELVNALPANEEGILQADIDLQDIDYSKNLLDPVGQYSRPDLMTLLVNTKEAQHVIELK
jgi:nitrilase